MKIKVIIIALISVVLFSGFLVYFFREPIKFAIIKSRAEAYLDRSPNSPAIIAQVKEIIPPCIDLWRREKLSLEEKKIISKTLMELQHNAPESLGGVPLTDDYLMSKVVEIKQIIERHQ